MSSIYFVRPAEKGVVLEKTWSQVVDALTAGCTALVPVQVGDMTALYTYNKTAKEADVYRLIDGAPWVQHVGAKPDLGAEAWDNVCAFVLGNEPCLMAYEREHGTFAFFRILEDLTVSKPYSFAYARITPTSGFTDVSAFTSLGQMFFNCYSFETGMVANFSLVVTSSSKDGVPPMRAQNVWYHQWAKGWTHFVFFQMGGANFFFKINTAKLNVNIDRMQDNPAMGSVEVGSSLQAQLPNALSITNTALVPWANGEPYLLTYIASSGATAVYRIHVDCQGWTSLDARTTEQGASQTIPYRIGGKSYVLFYRAR